MPTPYDFLNGINGGDKIHRITSVGYFLDLLKNRRLCLASPSTWQDPFENFLLNIELYKTSGERIELAQLRASFYCQCWSLHEESDLLWRAYSRDNLCVRISTSASALLSEVQKHFDLSMNEFVLSKIGKVIYKTQKEIEKIIQNEDDYRKFFDSEGFFDALLIKRKAFSAEREVRLMLRDHDRKNEPTLFFVKDFDLGFIDKVTFDPRIDTTIFEAIKDFICRYGISESKVERSNLYETKRFSLTLGGSRK